VARGKAKPKVATAVARRNLTGFMWAIAREASVDTQKAGFQVSTEGGARAPGVTPLASGPPVGGISRAGGEPSTELWTSASPIRPNLERGSSATNHSLGRTQPANIQQRQPSLERGAADQTDLKNVELGKSVLRGPCRTTWDGCAHLTTDSHINS